MLLFPSIDFCTISAFSLYGEYVVRSFLPNCVFLPYDYRLDFYISVLCENSIKKNNQLHRIEGGGGGEGAITGAYQGKNESSLAGGALMGVSTLFFIKKI